MTNRILLAFVYVAAAFAQMRPTTPSDDLEPVINRLIATQKAKGEFETTQDFEARQKRGFDPNRQLVLRVIDSKGFTYGARFEYDADARMMVLSLESGMEPTLFDFHESVVILNSKHVIRSSARHIGKTAFGATMPYTVSIENWYGLVIREPFPNWLSSYGQTLPHGDHRFEFSMPMTLSVAKATKPFLSVQIVGTIASPEVYHKEVNTTATINSPFEDSISQDYAAFNLQELRIVDARTGKVITSYKGDAAAVQQ